MRFSDESHFGLGLQGKLRITRKPGTRGCTEHIQDRRQPAKMAKLFMASGL